MRKTFGVFAHVDAGKTTFSERLLYIAGASDRFRRADKGESDLDRDELERSRGVTIFAECASFEYYGDTCCIVDTPGHIDFSGEAERSITPCDYAVLLIDGASPIRPRTRALFSALRENDVPCFIFVNKIDLAGYSRDRVTRDIRELLSEDAVDIGELSISNDELSEAIADRDDSFAEHWLEGKASNDELLHAMIRAIERGRLFPVFRGSALTGDGVGHFLECFSKLTVTDFSDSDELQARAFRIRIEGGKRLAYIKLDSGILRVRDRFGKDGEFLKVSELFAIEGTKLIPVREVRAGSVAAVAGLDFLSCGSVIKGFECIDTLPDMHFRPSMSVEVSSNDVDNTVLLSELHELSTEEPTLAARADEDTGAPLIDVMGELEKETLASIMRRRFGTNISLGNARTLFRETIQSPVLGIGHYEPLRHYAEVQLALVPKKRGSGLSFVSKCHLDDLPEQYSRAICSYVFARQQTGVMTNSPLDDIEFVLLAAKIHEKHTEGGDLREATWRAIRQALEKADPILLEPYCKFEAMLPEALSGKALSALSNLYAKCEPPERSGGRVFIRGRAPSRLIAGFSQSLPAMTHGEGELESSSCGYDICNTPNEIASLIGYERERDRVRTSSSIFCSHGAGYTVSWRETDELSHTRLKRSDTEILEEAGITLSDRKESAI